MSAASKEGESVGGTVECVALNVPVGVGEPMFDSLDADLAKALFNVPAVKAVEFGLGFEHCRVERFRKQRRLRNEKRESNGFNR